MLPHAAKYRAPACCRSSPAQRRVDWRNRAKRGSLLLIFSDFFRLSHLETRRPPGQEVLSSGRIEPRLVDAMRPRRHAAAAVLMFLMPSYTAEGHSSLRDTRTILGACPTAFAAPQPLGRLVPVPSHSVCANVGGESPSSGWRSLPKVGSGRVSGTAPSKWAMQQAGWSRPGELGPTMAQMIREKRK